MSGTSFDGVDVALIKTDGAKYIQKLDSNFVSYSSCEKKLFKTSIIKNYKTITNFIDNKHLSAIKKILNKNNNIDVIGVHGQTFYHKPELGWSWQYINVKKILKEFKINVVSDFRLSDVNNGGEGAPLVPIFHKNIILNKKFSLPAAILNIGGVSNITVVHNNSSLSGFDTGPGNGPLDALMNKRLGLHYDKNGKLAEGGCTNKKIKEKTLSLLKNSFHLKSYDRSYLDKICLTYLDSLDTKDALATLVDIITEFISLKIKHLKLKKLIISGGGRKNKFLISVLKSKLLTDVLSTENVGLDGDSLEAQAFAYLAVRSIKGEYISFKNTTGVNKNSTGGILHYFFN